ncbi:MAG: hypothetical protein ACLPQY_35850 [Streptosporangiaceae bacterium]
MNVKRAAATAAGIVATLLLAVAVGVGYLAGHSISSARAGGSTIAHAAASTHGAAAGRAAPVKATLDDQIYGDGLSVSIYGDGAGRSGGTTGSGDSGLGDGVTIGVTDSGGTATGTVTAAIYGD